MKMRKRISVLVVVLQILAAGCATNRGPGLISEARFNYNEQIIRSQNEQMLLNLVRLRYNDVPMFLDLSSVVTQYAIGNSANLSASSGIDYAPGEKTSGDSNASASTGISFNENPTMSYSPLQGENFAKKVLSPIAPETLVLLSQSGWRSSRLLLLCVQRLNGIPNAVTASGPMPSLKPEYEQFHGLAEKLRILQTRGLINVAVRKQEGGQSVWWIFEKGKSNAASERLIKEVYQELGLAPEKSEFRIMGNVAGGKGDSISMNTRSLLGVLYFLSVSVKPPEAHFERGLLGVTKTESGQAFDWSSVMENLLSVQSSKRKPDNAYVRTMYRGHWFFIDDRDLNSKSTFNLLYYLFALQSAEGSGASPLLTLSVS